MNPHILNTTHQAFITENLNADTTSLLLKKQTFEDVTIKELVEQIEAKTRCKSKLPTWFNSEDIYYPNKLNIEQTSSEITAKYKSRLVSGNNIIDLTGGFGVDTFYFSKCFDNVVHCEINSSLSKITEHNFKILRSENITTVNQNGIEFLKQSTGTFDCIYIDPSRRNETKGKVFFLSDCLPDVTEHLDLFLSKSKQVLIKASPMLDLTVGINELKFIKEIHIVAVQNEVKEVLFLIQPNFDKEIFIRTINFGKNELQEFNFKLSEEQNTNIFYSVPQNYLYEPNAAILKAGAFNSIASNLDVHKLHKHSHLYTSKELIQFPGRKFEIMAIMPYNKKLLQKQFKNKRANITTRNFPESVQQIRKKISIKDGGDIYLFFTTDINSNKIVIVTKAIKKVA